MRRLTVALLLLTGLVLYGQPASADEPEAADVGDVAVTQAALPLPDLLGQFDDGGACTGVPDAIPGIFDFTAACARHDACYRAGLDRLACDEAFREDMLAACQTQHPDPFDPRRFVCFGFAELYFTGVRVFGDFAFG